MVTEYRKPENRYRSSRDNEKLYKLEEKRDYVIDELIEEIKELDGLTDSYREALPEALLSLMESWDSKAVKITIQAYLERNGGL